MKVMMLVETSGPFQLSDMGSKNPLISSRNPTVVEATNFVQHRISLGQIKILGKVREGATNEDFMKCLADCDGDCALATASYLSECGLEEVATDASEAETKAEKRARKKAERKAEAEEAEEAAMIKADAEAEAAAAAAAEAATKAKAEAASTD